MSDIPTSKRLEEIEFAADLLVIQGFVALSWLTPWAWDADLVVALAVCVALASRQIVRIGREGKNKRHVGHTDE